jgi:hypothetical protein
MEMKAAAALLILFSQLAFAHDEGHGPALSDAGKYGGLVSSVVKKSDAGKGAKAELFYKAELSRAESSVRVYLYDKGMKPVDTAKFAAKASAMLSAKVKGKWKNTSFPLELKNGAFEGTMPKPEGKPYNIDVTLNSDETEFLSAFDNLD